MVFGLFDSSLHVGSAGWEQFTEGLNYRSRHANLLLYNGQARGLFKLLFKIKKLCESVFNNLRGTLRTLY